MVMRSASSALLIRSPPRELAWVDNEVTYPSAGIQDGMMGNSTMMDGNGSALADMQIPYSGHEWISFFLMTIGPSFLSSRLRSPFCTPHGIKNETKNGMT